MRICRVTAVDDVQSSVVAAALGREKSFIGHRVQVQNFIGAFGQWVVVHLSGLVFLMIVGGNQLNPTTQEVSTWSRTLDLLSVRQWRRSRLLCVTQKITW